MESAPATKRFELGRCLGEGGMGIVYEALDQESGTRVALKTLRHMTADSLTRLKREFRAMQDVEHPNLVSLGELASEDERKAARCATSSCAPPSVTRSTSIASACRGPLRSAACCSPGSRRSAATTASP
jgi:serine/threonine protein kinase